MKSKFFAAIAIVFAVPALIGITATTQSISSNGVPVESLPPVLSRMETLGGDITGLLVVASGLDEALSNCGTGGSNNGLPYYTVFVPREEIWTEVLESLDMSLGELLAQPALVKAVLLYHVVSGIISPTQIIDSFVTSLVSMGGLTLTITKVLEPLDVRINGEPLVLRDEGSSPPERLENLEACNGWTYQLDGLLAPNGGGPTFPPTEPGMYVSMTTSTTLTTTPYVPYTVQFSSQVKGVEPSDFANSGTAPGCSFSLAPRPAEWNSEFSVIVACNGLGTIVPVFASGGAIPISGSAGPATAATGPEAKIVTGPLVSVEVRSPGYGTVSSNPSGIDCGAVCTGEFSSNSIVTLTATPVNGHIFIGWSGACTGAQSCSVNPSGVTQVIAEFVRAGQLSVIKAGGGQGTVTSKPAGINCGSSCSAIYREGTQVALTATAARGSRFVGWFGSCSGQRTCTISIQGGGYQAFGLHDVFAVFERN